MTTLDDAGVKVQVDDVVVRGSVAKEYTLEVVAVQFPTANARHFNTDTGAEKLQGRCRVYVRNGVFLAMV
jgi:hypothetical protein